ncbi:hypothetical protein R1flu_027717 [Riccia fluitans]|uniref:B box-type domain-containing protein n=1 Tax=Riccia fluitans TaxID=41844 RepID=A0ABD1XJL7_9MARC
MGGAEGSAAVIYGQLHLPEEYSTVSQSSSQFQQKPDANRGAPCFHRAAPDEDPALCNECDIRIHAANKLANKHQRVSLTGPTESPRCDICQEKSAFFFCLEDRALLCRDCDVSIHSATARSSAHQRFLVPGTRVALEALESSSPATQETSTTEELKRHPVSSIINSTATNSSVSPSVSYKQSSYAPAPSYSSPASVKSTVMTSNKPVGVSNTSASHPIVSNTLTKRKSITEFLSDAIPNWRVDELLNIPELGEGYSLGDIASSKADQANLGDYDWTADLSLFDEQVYAESFHEVPQMFSPPTASGMGRPGRASGALKGKAKQDSLVPDYDDAFVVPDLGLHSAPTSPSLGKRRRLLEV